MEAAGRLDHKHIVRAMDAGESDGTLYLVMEQIDGVDVSRLLGDDSLGTAEACEIARQAAGGLAYAHGKNMVHRDIKPSNLMVTPDGLVKILDFGIATFETLSVNRAALKKDNGNQTVHEDSKHQTLAGSVAYMAPEQCYGNRDVQSSADIFALGCTLYELLTGHRPFALSGDILSQVQQRIESKPPKLNSDSATSPSALPKKLVQLVNRMMSVTPSERPRASEVAKQLQPFCHPNRLRKIVREHACPTTETWQPSTVEFTPNRKHRWRNAIAALVITATVCGCLFLGMSIWKNNGRAGEAKSLQSQFLAEMANVQFTPAAVTLQNEELTIIIRHGFNILIRTADGSTDVTSWNSLSLKIKHADAYALYAKHEATLRQINNQDIALYPHGPQPLEADLILLELRQEQHGWVRYDAWTPAESVRLWIGPTKMAVASVSRNGLEIESDVQPIDRLINSTEFGHWIADFLDDASDDQTSK